MALQMNKPCVTVLNSESVDERGHWLGFFKMCFLYKAKYSMIMENNTEDGITFDTI